MAALDRLNGLASETTLAVKAPCAVATTANITLSGIQTIDGVSVGSDSERVLVKSQTDATENNIYIASSGNWTLAQDAGGNTDWTLGTLVLVVSGLNNAGGVFQQTCADSPIVIGTSLLAFAVAQFGALPYVSNGGAVQAGPYNTIQSGAANFGPSTGQTSLEFVTVGQVYRIRQAGTVTKFKIQLPSVTGISALYLKIWRAQGTSYDLVGTSENVAGRITAGANTLTLVTPIAGVLPGDYIGARVEYSSASVQNLRSTVVANTSSDDVATVVYSVLNATPSTSQYNWAGHTVLSGSAVIAEVFMAAPIFVTIGDSITSGLPTQGSFADNNRVIAGLYSGYPTVLGTQLGYTCQNVGIGGDTAGGVAARFAADVVAKNPKFVIIMIGVNDLLAGTTNASILASFTSMLNAAVAAGIYPVVIGVMPFRTYSAATTPMLQQRDLLNAALRTLVSGPPYSGLYVSPDAMGVYYSGGDADNLWTLATAPLDGLHPSPDGYAILAQLLYDALQRSNTAALAGNNPGRILSLSQGNAVVGVGAFALNSTGFRNTVFGASALAFNRAGSSNTAIGNSALFASGLNGAAAINNTAVGASALFANISGTDNDAFGFNALNANTASFNGAFGSGALANNTSGFRNVAIGYQSQFVCTTGSQNTSIGFNSLFGNSTGTDNTAVGEGALFMNTASSMTAVGSGALTSNTSGIRNTAVGYQSLTTNSTGSNNTGVGYQSLLALTTGTNNTGIGMAALFSNSVGTDNTAVGFDALFSVTASDNSALGSAALGNTTSGAQNSAVGSQALPANITGQQNVAVGYQSLLVSTADTGNTGIGFRALADLNGGSNNTAIGSSAGRGIVTGSNNTVIGGVTGLSSSLAGAIILGDGAGNIRLDYGKTTAGVWTALVPLVTKASATGAAGFNLPTGTAPTSPADGDMWQDGTNFKIRINGVTKTVTLT